MIKLCDVYKHYLVGSRVINAINGINLEINRKEFVLITGESGSGKSTLLNIISNVDRITAGTYYYENKDIDLLSQNELDEIGRKDFGIITQEYNLFENETVFKNLEYSAVLIEPDEKERKRLIEKVLNDLSISSLKFKKARSLSGGEKQRVAIARALVKKPKVIFADEITSNLDEKNCKLIAQILKKISKDVTVIVVTHDEKLFAKYADKIVVLSDGKIVKIKNDTKKKEKTNLVGEKSYDFKKSNFFGLFKNFGYLVFLFIFSFISLFAPLVIYDATTSSNSSEPLINYSNYFVDVSKNRNVIIKNDRTKFDDSDINYFSSLSGFQNIFFQDILLDSTIDLRITNKGSQESINTHIRPISEIKEVKEGRLPSNDFEVVTNDSFITEDSNIKEYLSFNKNDYYEVKQVGICSDVTSSIYNSLYVRVYYISDRLIEILYADYIREFNRHTIYNDNLEVESTNIYLSDLVEKGTVVTTNSKYQNQIVNLNIDSSYHVNAINNLNVVIDENREIIDKDNKFEDVFVLNRDEYINVVNNNYTQISVFSNKRIKPNEKYNVFYPGVNQGKKTVKTIMFNILYAILFVVITTLISIVSLLMINKISNKDFNDYKILRNIGYSNKQNITRLLIRNILPVVISAVLNIILFSLFKVIANYARITGNETLLSIFIGALSYPQIILLPLIFMIIYTFVLLNNQLKKYRLKVINRNDDD